MSNKNLIIGLGVAVVVYYLYNQNQKKKLQTVPYTDVELDKVVTTFINQQLSLAKVYEPNKSSPDAEKGKKEVFDMIKKASLIGKDVSRANVDRILAIYDKSIRNQYGDKSIGVATPEEIDLFADFRGLNVNKLAQTPAQPNYSLQFEDKPCKKWVQPLCKTTPCPPICGEY